MQTTIDTPFGPMRLVVNNATSAVLLEPEHGTIRIHRTDYDDAVIHLQIDADRHVRFAAEPWNAVRISRVKPGYYYTRQECSPSALRLAIDTLPGVVERFLAEHPELVDLAEANDLEEQLNRALNERTECHTKLEALNTRIRDLDTRRAALAARMTGKD